MKSHILLAALSLNILALVFPSNAFAVVQSLNSQTGHNQTFQNDSNVTISSAGNVHSLGWQGLLPFSRGGTGASSFSSGSIPFSNGTSLSQNNANLFWDITNNRLGIGTNSPTNTLSVNGNGNVTGNLNVTGTISASNFNPSTYVPYTGATTDVNLGTRNLTTNGLTSTGDSKINGLTVGLGGGSHIENTVVGKDALKNTTTGTYNTAIGEAVLHDNSTGEFNTGIGTAALKGNTTGSNNTGLGFYALNPNTTGNNNVAIGERAGFWQVNGQPLTSPESSIYIGLRARGYDDNDNNSIVIGTEAEGAGANKAVIGNASITDVYFGSSNANADAHAKKLFLGNSTIPGCIVMGDTNGGIGYVTLVSGALTVSSTKPAACN